MIEQYPQSQDDLYIQAEIARAEDEDRNIGHTAARMIASQFHGGQASALYSLTSCGAIDMERLRDEYLLIYADPHTPEADKLKLDHLGTYLIEHGERGPVEGWSDLWGGNGR